MQEKKVKIMLEKAKKQNATQFKTYTPGQPFGIRKNREKLIKSNKY